MRFLNLFCSVNLASSSSSGPSLCLSPWQQAITSSFNIHSSGLSGFLGMGSSYPTLVTIQTDQTDWPGLPTCLFFLTILTSFLSHCRGYTELFCSELPGIWVRLLFCFTFGRVLSLPSPVVVDGAWCTRPIQRLVRWVLLTIFTGWTKSEGSTW
jgi:hypothetical protein